MKPDSRNDGSSVNWANCIACIWFADTVEKVMPSARLPAMKKPERDEQQRQRAAHRQLEEQRRGGEDDQHLDVADGDDTA